MLEHIDGLLIWMDAALSEVVNWLEVQDIGRVARGDVSDAWDYI